MKGWEDFSNMFLSVLGMVAGLVSGRMIGIERMS